jgi:hypothetical protein
MARPRKRVRLEEGLKLDVNKLVRGGLLPRGSEPLTFSTSWTSNRQGVIASAFSTIQKESDDRGSFRVTIVGKTQQRLELVACPRHFGGQQWYFKCPVTGKNCSVVWLPPGANRFCSRQAWGKEVAYSTQFESKFDRAITAREKVKDRLIGELNRSEWDLPPKPKWMRWHTYERFAEKYDFQEGIIDQCMADFVAREVRG